MTYARSSIPDFSLANALYAAATVTVYEADASGVRGTTLAPLFERPVGGGYLVNPQTLDRTGKFVAPVYVDRDVVAVVTGRTIETHETGVIVLQSLTDYAVDPFTGDGTTTVFTLSRNCFVASFLDVTIDGARQQPDTAYTVNGLFTITFTEPPPVNAEIFVVHSATPAPLSPVLASGSAANLSLWTHTGDGATTAFSITGATLSNVTSYLVSLNGVIQEPAAAYGVNPSTDLLTFTEAPPSGCRIVIVCVGFARPVTEFGVHTATSDTAVSGYITIVDVDGVTRKLAVIT